MTLYLFSCYQPVHQFIALMSQTPLLQKMKVGQNHIRTLNNFGEGSLKYKIIASAHKKTLQVEGTEISYYSEMGKSQELH